ncbi:MAG: cysteine hydrolase family protein [Desulfomonilaceae bacterium]
MQSGATKANVALIPVVFLDVDTQRDFIIPDGCLSIKGADSITPNLAKLSRYSSEKQVVWLSTMDSHVLDDTEISSEPDFKTTFPPHCMNDTAGKQRIEATSHPNPLVLDMQTGSLDKPWPYIKAHYDSIVFKKNNIDVFSNENLDRLLSCVKPLVFVVFGVATDFCVKSAVEGLLLRNLKVVLVKDAVYAIDQDVEKLLFNDWERQGVKLMTTHQIINLNPHEFEKLFQ